MMQTDEIEDLAAGNFSLDLPEIVLSRKFGGKTSQIGGAGYLRQEKKSFELKIFTGDSAANRSLFIENMSTPAGTLIGNDTFFDLTAKDEGGRVWKSNGIRLEGSLAGSCISCRCDEISHERELKISSRDSIALTFFEPLNLPGNTTLRTEKQVGDGKPFLQSVRAICQFRSCGYAFDVDEKQLWTRLHVLAEEVAVDLHLPQRIVEALEFCRGQELRPSIVECLSHGTLGLTLIANRTRTGSNRKPPLAAEGEDFFRFFEAVLQKVILYQGEQRKRTPISRVFQYLIQMNNASVDAQALALGVAVEALLKAEFGQLGTPPAKFVDDLEKVAEFLAGSDLSEIGKKRIPGAINAMRGTRAQDILVALQGHGLIESSLIESWKKLRHRSAHAGSHKFDQDFINLCGAVRVLWHHLFFLAIGYQGSYIDYGTLGWPKREFSAIYKTCGAHYGRSS